MKGFCTGEFSRKVNVLKEGCPKNRLLSTLMIINCTLSQLLTFWSLINRLGTVKLNGWHGERKPSVGNVFHPAQLLRCQEKIKWTGDRHVVALLNCEYAFTCS